MTITTNLSLPTWDEGNTEPNLVFNQLLAACDALVQCTAQAITSTPPATPTIGWVWIVGASPTGAWSGKTNQLAVAVTGGWVFYAPANGWAAFVVSEGQDYQLVAGVWGPRSGGSGGSGVPSVNGITGAVTIQAGTGTSVITASGVITISAEGGTGTFVDPTTDDYDIIMRKVTLIDEVGIGFVGDSITAGTTLGGGANAPPPHTADDLSNSGFTVTDTNQGVSGATSAMWIGGGSYMTTALAAFASATPRPRIVHIMLGTNDSKTAVATSTDDYRANLLSASNALIAAGYLVAISYPPYLNTSSGEFDAASTARVESYLAVIDSLVDNNHIFQGDTAGYGYFQANLGELAGDGVHPTQDGSDHLAGLWATALQPLVNSVGNTVALRRAVFGSDFTVTEVGGVLTIVSAGSPTAGIPVNRQTGTSYTIDASDNGKAVEMSNASANTVTIPSGLDDGFNCLVTQVGIGQTTVSAGSGATLRNPNPTAKTRSQWASLTVRRTNTASEYVLDGNAAAT